MRRLQHRYQKGNEPSELQAVTCGRNDRIPASKGGLELATTTQRFASRLARLTALQKSMQHGSPMTMTTSSRNSGASATPCATTASTTATTSSRSPTCSSSRWPTSGRSTCRRAATGRTLRDKSGTDLTDHYIDVLRTLGKTAGHPRRHLRRGPVALQQPGQPQEAHRPHRRDRVDHPRRRREGRSLRGAAGKGRQRGQEGRRASTSRRAS